MAVVLVWVVELPLQEATLALVLVWVACGVEKVEVLRQLSVVTSMMITVARLIMENLDGDDDSTQVCLVWQPGTPLIIHRFGLCALEHIYGRLVKVNGEESLEGWISLAHTRAHLV